MNILISETSLYSLPPEILLEILAQVPDITTLRSAISSCRYLRSIFLEFGNVIVEQVLKTFLGSDRIHDAVAIENLRRTSDPSASLSEYLNIEHCLDIPKWNMQELHRVEQLHLSVQYFSRDLIARIQSDQDLRDRGFTLQSEPTTTEISRIERSLYQLEALFRYQNSRGGDDEAIKSSVAHFISHFSPWENEQLACVYWHLGRSVSQAIEDVCYNDLNWLEYLTATEESPEAITQEFLANGLVAAHTAVKAESFERRKENLGPPDNAFKPTLELIIGEILEDAVNSPALYSFHEDDDLEFIKRPLWQENDPGPEESWRWAHQLEGSMDFFFSVTTFPLRKFAYVLWDKDRLSALDVFSQHWQGENRDEFFAVESERMRNQQDYLMKRRIALTQERKMHGSVHRVRRISL